MKLRHQMVLLTSGIVLVPFMIGIIMIFAIRGLDGSERVNYAYRYVSGDIYAWLNSDRQQALPSWKTVYIRVYDEQRQLLAESGRNTETFQEWNHGIVDLVSSHYTVNNQDYRVDIFYPAGSWKFERFTELLTLIFPIGIIIFTATMSGWILRTLHQRIRNLEQITHRIAAGDLTVDIPRGGHDEFSALNNSLAHMQQQLRSEKENRTRLLMGISHDLKTPLAGIQGYIQAIKDGLAQDEQQRMHYLDIIHKKADLLSQRVMALIAFVKIETSQWTLERKPIKLKSTLDAWLAEFRDDLEVNGYKSDFTNLLADDAKLTGDEVMLRRAFENLMSNAMKYSAADSCISFNAEQQGSFFVFRLCNPGAPLSSEQQRRLFEPFFRADNGRNSEGIGLGLTVVEKVIELHLGHISYIYQQDRHCFSIHLPAM